METNSKGVKTSEFWVTAISFILGFLVTLGIISPEETATYKETLIEVIGGLMIVVPTTIYIITRAWVKIRSLFGSKEVEIKTVEKTTTEQ